MTTSRSARTRSTAPPRRLRSRLAAIVLAVGLLGATASIGAVVWHDIEVHSSTEAAP